MRIEITVQVEVDPRDYEDAETLGEELVMNIEEALFEFDSISVEVTDVENGDDYAKEEE